MLESGSKVSILRVPSLTCMDLYEGKKRKRRTCIYLSINHRSRPPHCSTSSSSPLPFSFFPLSFLPRVQAFHCEIPIRSRKPLLLRHIVFTRFRFDGLPIIRRRIAETKKKGREKNKDGFDNHRMQLRRKRKLPRELATGATLFFSASSVGPTFRRRERGY